MSSTNLKAAQKMAGPAISDNALNGPGMGHAAGSQVAFKLSTGLERLDLLLGGGLPRQSLVAVAGIPGAGKSVLVLHVIANAIQQGCPALYVTTTHHPAEKLREQYSSLNFLKKGGLIQQVEFFELRPKLLSGGLSDLLNVVVSRLQEKATRVVAIDSFRTVSDLATSRGEFWRFLGELGRQLVMADCIGLLAGEYVLPRDMDLPELAMADVVLYLEVERQPSSDLRTMRVYKLRGGPHAEGRNAFVITDDGIQLLS